MIGLAMLTKFEQYYDGDIDAAEVIAEWKKRKEWEERIGNFSPGQMASDYFPLCYIMDEFIKKVSEGDAQGARQTCLDALVQANWYHPDGSPVSQDDE